MKRSRVLSPCMGAVLGLGLLVSSGPAFAQIGTDLNGVGTSSVEFGSLAPAVVESGFVTLSIDAMGTLAATGAIQVEKPPGATVRKAYLMSASTGFTGFRIPNGGVSINGTGVNWDIQTSSGISSWNHWADVTAIVKPIVDAAPAGTVDLTIGEQSSGSIDGEVLAVILDDPNRATVSTIVLAFGAQAVGGDTFQVTLADPIDLAMPGLVLDMSLGISYGYQTAGQYSIVEVNGQRLTTSAGGQDDGQPNNGALITAGGVGDTNANPPNPLATDSGGARYDDELYNLKPFVQDGEKTITIFTQNPSNDDNIFFAAFVLSGGAVINEGILLSPPYAENEVGTTHTVTADVLDDGGNPIVGREVTFVIESGPHAGLTATGNTDAHGQVTFAYLGGATGIDHIVATMVDSRGRTVRSNTVLKKWNQTCVAPEAYCTPSTKVSNSSKYYRELTGTSACYACDDLDLYVSDTATPAFVAGPFACGDVVRINKGLTAKVRAGSYGVTALITVKGQATVWAVDPDGRVGAAVVCP